MVCFLDYFGLILGVITETRMFRFALSDPPAATKRLKD